MFLYIKRICFLVHNVSGSILDARGTKNKTKFLSSRMSMSRGRRQDVRAKEEQNKTENP